MTTKRNSSWTGSHADLEKPSAARIYDYWLGGHHNFEVDRRVAEQVLTVAPQMRQIAVANRSFLRRSVTFLVEEGIEQFLDLGSGIPTVGNVHEVAQTHNPDARVVYVDVDPIAVAHSQTILQHNPKAIAVQADLRQIERILADPDAGQLLDLRKPIGVLFVSVLHFVVDDDEAHRVIHTLRDSVASGSFLVISHVTEENIPAAINEQIRRLYENSTTPGKTRTRDEIAHLFDDFELVAPGLVWVPEWRPDSSDDLLLDQPEGSMLIAGVARKP